MPGALPDTMNSAASWLMASSWTLPASSVNASGGAGGNAAPAAWISRAMNDAIAPRVTEASGENVVGDVPLVRPRSNAQSMSSACTFVAGTSVNGAGAHPDGGGGGGGGGAGAARTVMETVVTLPGAMPSFGRYVKLSGPLYPAAG